MLNTKYKTQINKIFYIIENFIKFIKFTRLKTIIH